jgi:hypothetical protein
MKFRGEKKVLFSPAIPFGEEKNMNMSIVRFDPSPAVSYAKIENDRKVRI